MTIMPEAFICPSCSKNLPPTTDGRPPPWCTYCGVDMKTDAARAALPLPSRPFPSPTPFGPAGLIETGDAAPNQTYFHACVPAFSEKNHRLFRIYTMPSDLLVFALGGWVGSDEQTAPRTPSTQPSPAGIPGATATLHESKPSHLTERIAELDAADAMTLRQIAESGDRAFVVGRDDVKTMTLAGPSFWWRWICKVGHEGLLKFDHRKQGQVTYALLRPRDARRAFDHLPRIFGERLQISLSWGTARRN
jgi:hypothetical protein